MFDGEPTGEKRAAPAVRRSVRMGTFPVQPVRPSAGAGLKTSALALRWRLPPPTMRMGSALAHLGKRGPTGPTGLARNSSKENEHEPLCYRSCFGHCARRRVCGECPVGAHADTLVTHHAEWAMFPNTLATFEFIASPHDKLVVTVMPDNGTVSINKGPEYPIGGLFGYGQHVQNEFGHVHLENTLGEVKAGWMTIIHAVGKWNMVNRGPLLRLLRRAVQRTETENDFQVARSVGRCR